MCTPLYDDKGIVRYFVGAQIDGKQLLRLNFSFPIGSRESGSCVKSLLFY
jgi:hypothetical protein